MLAHTLAAFVGGVLMLGSLAPAQAQGTSGNPPRSSWYLSGNIGVSWASQLDQEGWNREGTCYPTDACFDIDPIPSISGYRWRYAVGASIGRRTEFALGRDFDRVRLELAFTRRNHGLDQAFRGISFYDGAPIGARSGGTVVSNPEASIDDLRVWALAGQVFYDFPAAPGRPVPYLGIGLGPAFVTVRGVRFSTRYEDTAGNDTAYDPPLSFYDSRQDEDLSDTVLAAHLHAGMDFELNERMQTGARLTYSMLGAVEAAGVYETHPWHAQDPGLLNHNMFTRAGGWSLGLTLRVGLGD